MSWKEIWAKEKKPVESNSVLAKLISVTGAKERFQQIGEKFWVQEIRKCYKWLGIEPGDSLYEVGCGAGAWLYPYYSEGNRVGGIDFSPFLIGMSKEYLPKGEFTVGEAIECVAEPQYDCVSSHSTFRYFPDYDYATKVVEIMLKKAKRKVGIFSVPDAAREKEFEAYRRGTLPEGEYEKLYKDLHYLYYSEQFFRSLGDRFGVKIEIARRIPAAFRFHVIMDPNRKAN